MNVAVLGTRFAARPFVGTIGVELLFPDRDGRFQFIDHVAAGVERGFAMRGGNGDDHGDIPDGQRAGAVLAGNGMHVELFQCGRDDLVALGFRHARVGLVVEPENVTSTVVIPHAALEGHESAAGGVLHAGEDGGGVDGGGGDFEHASWKK